VFFLLLLNSLAAQANSALDQGKSSLSAVQSMVAISNQNPTAPTIDHCESLVTHLDPVVVTPIRKPPHMKLFRDPAFATKNRRITNSLAGQVFHPLENSAQSWNSDESLLLLQSYNEDNSSKFNLMDGSTYQSLGDLNISSAINNSVYWSQENSLSVLYVSDTEDSAGQLLRFDIATGTESLIKDFAPYCEQNGYPITGGKFPKPSFDDDLFSFQCGSESGKSLAISYRYSSDEIHTVQVGESTRWFADQPPVPSVSGDKFIFQGFSVDDTLKSSIVGLRGVIADAPYQVS
jgi:hypothetical protein